MKNRRYLQLQSEAGFTLVEVLIALILSSVVTIAALKFYEIESNNLLTQQNIAETQQSLRASLFEVSSSLRNSGANLPKNLVSLQSADTNPDTLLIRFASSGGSMNVGLASPATALDPINVPLGSDLSQFPVGASVFIWYDSKDQGEWFTVSSTNSNVGTGWDEIFHAGGDLLFAPQAGDVVIAMQESRFFIDASDTAKPLLMRGSNGLAAQVYAEYINDFQVDFLLTTSDTVDVLGPNDTAATARISMSAFTANIDYNEADRNKDGRRSRVLATEVMIRNGRN